MNPRRWFLLFCALAVAAAAAPERPLILLSLDGFRWDYCEKYPDETPTLRRLRAEGTTARSLIPVFPTNTFPNHYTIITGRYPAKHGIVNNDFFDPDLGKIFHYFQPAAVRESVWWGAEPIWVTAELAGLRTAVSFWVGSEAEIKGRRPTFWKRYDYSQPWESRLEEIAGWLTRPAGDRVSFLALYLEETNSAGHTHGPDDPATAAAVRLVDRRVAELLARLHAAGVAPDLVVVSDHGMTATSAERVVILDDYIDRDRVQLDADGSVVSLRPLDGDVEALHARLTRVPRARVYRAADLPAHFRLRDNPRIAPLWILPEEGWHVETRANFERLKKRYAARGYLGGDHGYDPALPSMHGFFLAHGPSFARGVTLPAFENVNVYALLCAVLGLTPAEHDGDAAVTRAALRSESR